MSARGGGSAGSTGASRIRRRDWVVVAVVAAIALGLGGYLLLRPSGSGDDGAAPVGPPSSASQSTSSGAGSVTSPSTAAPSLSPTRSRSSSSAPSSAPSGPTTTASQPADQRGVIDSMIQPSAVTEVPTTAASKAPRIGPFGDLSRRIKGDPMALGRVDAPVVMVTFEDLRCPFCAQFSRTTLPTLIEKYVKTGILRIEWRDLPIFGPESTQAAIAGRAAAAQHKFWEFVRAIYADAPRHGHPDLPRDKLIDYARQVGVADIAAFTADLDDPELAAAVDKDLDQGSVLGVPSTPAFVIDGYPIVGAQPLAQFTDLIDTVRTLR